MQNFEFAAFLQESQSQSHPVWSVTSPGGSGPRQSGSRVPMGLVCVPIHTLASFRPSCDLT